MNATRLSRLAAIGYGAVFTGLVFHYRFELPRFDYWDVAYAATTVALPDPGSLARYLFGGNESMMAMPKMVIYLSNTLAGGWALVLEHILALLLGIGAHALLLRILRLPVFPGPGAGTETALRWWVVLALFWWPAVLPAYTNTWFATQYGLTLFFGLLAVHLYREDAGAPRLACCYAAWLAGAVTHGTGLILGPVLAFVAVGRDRRRGFAAALLAGTGVVLWVQHLVSTGVMHNVLRLEAPFSLEHLKFMARAITPPMWESALFVLIVAPLLLLTAWRYAGHFRDSIDRPYAPLILWGLAVWVSIWLARGGFQTHANPHYLRFFVVLYAAWAMMLLDLRPRAAGPGLATWTAGAVLVAVWLKGAAAGIGQAESYRDQILAGAAVLRGESTETASLCYLYPDGGRLTRVLLPGLVRSGHPLYASLDDAPPSTRPCE